MTSEQIVDSVTWNMILSDSGKDENNSAKAQMLTFQLFLKCQEISQKLCGNIYECFCSFENYINIAYISSRNVQTKITYFMK